MTDYYIKKDLNNEAHLYLQCSVNSSNNALTVQAVSVYSDATCLQSCSPGVGASDAFNTSQGSCTIHLQPTSGTWTFQARKKSSSNQDLSNPLYVTGTAASSVSFAVVATASGYSDLVLDPIIKFCNSAMQQAGTPTGLMLASAYLDPPLRGAHGISLVLPIGPSDQPGYLAFDPNPHPLDGWGDPVGPSIYAPRLHEVEAVVQVGTDEARGRNLARLDCKGLHDARIFLWNESSTDRWTLIYAPGTGGRLVVPLFRQ